MSDERKPWAEPGLSDEERVKRILDEFECEGADLNHYPVLDAILAAALRAARADALEEAARTNKALAAKQRAKNNLDAAGWLTSAAGEIRALKGAP